MKAKPKKKVAALESNVLLDDPRCKIIRADMLEYLDSLEADSFDACVTDPPYELNFMSKGWDNAGVSFDPKTWEKVYRVLKPGAHIAAFGGTRTFHRICCAIEDAGFEIRDCLQWVYGCLSEDTEVLVNGRWKQYTDIEIGDQALGYDIEKKEFSWQEIKEIFIYDYDDTAYHIQSDCTDQIVSRNHRCVIEREGETVFQLAEDAARKRQAAIPVVEDMQSLLKAIPYMESHTGVAEHNVLERMSPNDTEKVQTDKSPRQSCTEEMSSLRKDVLEIQKSRQESQDIVLFREMQRNRARARVEKACTQRSSSVDGEKREIIQREDVRIKQSCLEGRGNLLSETRQLQTDKVRTMPDTVQIDVTKRRLRWGTPSKSSKGIRSSAITNGSSSSYQSRSTGQSTEESPTIQEQSRPQIVRASRFTKTTLARITSKHYQGKMWCIRIPTGAFIARRNGHVFITGNSGFPKSRNIGKAIDAEAGVERDKKVFTSRPGMAKSWDTGSGKGWSGVSAVVDTPITPEAEYWDGWGTGLKPSWEPIILARKPISEKTVADNVLKYGTGAINIGACKIGTEQRVLRGSGRQDRVGKIYGVFDSTPAKEVIGRWPANFILSHSPECVCVGTRTDKGYVINRFKDGAKPFGNGAGHEYESENVSGGEVDVWACVPGCPVRMMDEQSGSSKSSQGKPRKGKQGNGYGMTHTGAEHSDSGGASRFFYTAKASTGERSLGLPLSRRNMHPTVKPVSLMRWLCRLLTPPDGLVLDPFAGSGTTGVAAVAEGFRGLLIERDADSANDCVLRVNVALKLGANIGKVKRFKLKGRKKRRTQR